MHLSGHAEKRSQQGGRRLRNIEFVVEYGEATSSGSTLVAGKECHRELIGNRDRAHFLTAKRRLGQP